MPVANNNTRSHSPSDSRQSARQRVNQVVSSALSDADGEEEDLASSAKVQLTARAANTISGGRASKPIANIEGGSLPPSPSPATASTAASPRSRGYTVSNSTSIPPPSSVTAIVHVNNSTPTTSGQKPGTSGSGGKAINGIVQSGRRQGQGAATSLTNNNNNNSFHSGSVGRDGTRDGGGGGGGGGNFTHTSGSSSPSGSQQDINLMGVGSINFTAGTPSATTPTHVSSGPTPHDYPLQEPEEHYMSSDENSSGSQGGPTKLVVAPLATTAAPTPSKQGATTSSPSTIAPPGALATQAAANSDTFNPTTSPRSVVRAASKVALQTIPSATTTTSGSSEVTPVSGGGGGERNLSLSSNGGSSGNIRSLGGAGSGGGFAVSNANTGQQHSFNNTNSTLNAGNSYSSAFQHAYFGGGGASGGASIHAPITVNTALDSSSNLSHATSIEMLQKQRITEEEADLMAFLGTSPTIATAPTTTVAHSHWAPMADPNALMYTHQLNGSNDAAFLENLLGGGSAQQRSPATGHGTSVMSPPSVSGNSVGLLNNSYNAPTSAFYSHSDPPPQGSSRVHGVGMMGSMNMAGHPNAVSGDEEAFLREGDGGSDEGGNAIVDTHSLGNHEDPALLSRENQTASAIELATLATTTTNSSSAAGTAHRTFSSAALTPRSIYNDNGTLGSSNLVTTFIQGDGSIFNDDGSHTMGTNYTTPPPLGGVGAPPSGNYLRNHRRSVVTYVIPEGDASKFDRDGNYRTNGTNNNNNSSNYHVLSSTPTATNSVSGDYASESSSNAPDRAVRNASVSSALGDEGPLGPSALSTSGAIGSSMWGGNNSGSNDSVLAVGGGIGGLPNFYRPAQQEGSDDKVGVGPLGGFGGGSADKPCSFTVEGEKNVTKLLSTTLDGSSTSVRGTSDDGHRSLNNVTNGLSPQPNAGVKMNPTNRGNYPTSANAIAAVVAAASSPVAVGHRQSNTTSTSTTTNGPATLVDDDEDSTYVDMLVGSPQQSPSFSVRATTNQKIIGPGASLSSLHATSPEKGGANFNGAVSRNLNLNGQGGVGNAGGLEGSMRNGGGLGTSSNNIGIAGFRRYNNMMPPPLANPGPGSSMTNVTNGSPSTVPKQLRQGSVTSVQTSASRYVLPSAKSSFHQGKHRHSSSTHRSHRSRRSRHKKEAPEYDPLSDAAYSGEGGSGASEDEFLQMQMMSMARKPSPKPQVPQPLTAGEIRKKRKEIEARIRKERFGQKRSGGGGTANNTTTESSAQRASLSIANTSMSVSPQLPPQSMPTFDSSQRSTGRQGAVAPVAAPVDQRDGVQYASITSPTDQEAFYSNSNQAALLGGSTGYFSGGGHSALGMPARSTGESTADTDSASAGRKSGSNKAGAAVYVDCASPPQLTSTISQQDNNNNSNQGISAKNNDTANSKPTETNSATDKNKKAESKKKGGWFSRRLCCFSGGDTVEGQRSPEEEKEIKRMVDEEMMLLYGTSGNWVGDSTSSHAVGDVATNGKVTNATSTVKAMPNFGHQNGYMRASSEVIAPSLQTQTLHLYACDTAYDEDDDDLGELDMSLMNYTNNPNGSNAHNTSGGHLFHNNSSLAGAPANLNGQSPHVGLGRQSTVGPNNSAIGNAAAQINNNYPVANASTTPPSAALNASAMTPTSLAESFALQGSASFGALPGTQPHHYTSMRPNPLNSMLSPSGSHLFSPMSGGGLAASGATGPNGYNGSGAPPHQQNSGMMGGYNMSGSFMMRGTPSMGSGRMPMTNRTTVAVEAPVKGSKAAREGGRNPYLNSEKSVYNKRSREDIADEQRLAEFKARLAATQKPKEQPPAVPMMGAAPGQLHHPHHPQHQRQHQVVPSHPNYNQQPPNTSRPSPSQPDIMALANAANNNMHLSANYLSTRSTSSSLSQLYSGDGDDAHSMKSLGSSQNAESASGSNTSSGSGVGSLPIHNSVLGQHHPNENVTARGTSSSPLPQAHSHPSRGLVGMGLPLPSQPPRIPSPVTSILGASNRQLNTSPTRTGATAYPPAVSISLTTSTARGHGPGPGSKRIA